MCIQSCLDFVTHHLSVEEVRGRSVLEVGSFDVNGSPRPIVTALEPASYLGVDMQAGKGVDEVCSAEQLITRFGENSFDIVVSTEMMEHVFDWRVVLHNLKGVVKPGGILLITTVSIGFGYHAYPYDFWRYQGEDMEALFADFQITALVADPVFLGVGVKASKPEPFVEADLSGHALYSMINRRRSIQVSAGDISRFHLRRRILQPMRTLEQGIRRLRNAILHK